LKVSHLSIENFRGISAASLLLPDHAVLIGDNNTGKSTILEALDLVLGPDRPSRATAIDEHDFHLGKYLGETKEPADGGKAAAAPAPEIRITATIIGLSAEQTTHFRAHIEWWDTEKQTLYDGEAAARQSARNCLPARHVHRAL
jgi:putative ATP-dependent endonuclease of the OLD family